jgi:simple sugar transport system permease protein
MRIGRYEVRHEKRSTLKNRQAALIAILAIVFALVLFSIIFILDGVNPVVAYREIFGYAFANPFGLPLTINRFAFLLLCTCAFIVPYRAGLWNIGMTGQLYVGALCAFAVAFAAVGNGSGTVGGVPGLLMLLMLLAAGVGGAALGGIAGSLKGKLDLNEIVVTMMLNFIVFWLVSLMIKDGGLFMNPGGRGESFELPPSLHAPLILDIPVTAFLALGLATLLYFVFARARIGYQIKAYGESPRAAVYAGISAFKIPLLVFVMGGVFSGLAGYHYFAAVPGVYKIARNYGSFGDLAFYGIICGLISLGNPLTAIPVALLFGGLSIGGRYVQGKLHVGFGVDLALLGVLMITLVAFQFFYRYKIVWTETGEKLADVGVRR